MEFTKQNEAVNEVFTCENENYKYTAEVVKTNDEIQKVTLSVFKKTGNGEQHVGYLSLQNGNKSTSCSEGENIIPHVSVFEEFLEGLNK